MNYLTIDKLKCHLMLGICFGIMGLQACKKDAFLDVDNTNAVNSKTAFSTEPAADLILNDIYNNLPDGYADYNYDAIENWSDNALCGYPWTGSSNALRDKANLNASFDLGTLNSGTFVNSLSWGRLFGNVRKCNLFIAGLATASSLSDGYKKQRLGEAKILRAYFYQWLWMLYGGVPIITKADDRAADGDAIFHARASSSETFKFINDELAAAVALLPDNKGNDGGGRVNKGAALTLKGWAELYYASQLNNPGNDKSRWAAAAATNKLVMGLGYSLYPKYDELFFSTGTTNNEGIFYIQHIANVKPSKLSGFNGPREVEPGRGFGWGNSSVPTQDLVDDYCMMDGTGISEPGSTFDPNNPYANREPRFYQTIVFNGSTFDGYPMYTYIGSGGNAIDKAPDGTVTGYSRKKGLDTTVNIFNGSLSSQSYYIFRFAEVLLNYAEAQNEAVGPDASVYDALDAIRVRAKLPLFSKVYGGVTQDKMRELIRRERRVELAFEDKRYFDLLRWKIAAQKLDKTTMTGMSITKAGNKFTYTKVPANGQGVAQWTFNPAKNYLFPIPINALGQNKLLKQNPDYQ